MGDHNAMFSLIQKLAGRRVEMLDLMARGDKDMYGKLVDDLRIILDFSREGALAKGRKLSYLMSYVNEIALDLNKLDDGLNLYTQMKFVHGWIGEVKNRMLRLGVDGGEPVGLGSVTVGEEEEDEVEDVVGLEEDVRLFLRGAIFNEEERHLSTSLITGMVGSGKTTLARRLYSHPAVVDRFERHAWVRVFADSTHKEILVKLIQQVVDSEEFSDELSLEKMDNQSLQQTLNQHLSGMRYFIVLDDFLKEMILTNILKGLPSEGEGSRLLLTSRSRDIQAAIHYSHEMKALDSDKSWQLFLKTINKLTSEEEFPKELDKRGREKLAKCGGLPLAIKGMGKQFAEKRNTGSEWEELLESIDIDATLDLFELFYHNMDPLVKPCFLQLALFKGNSTMRAEKMIQVCAAGGMAPLYLHRLLNESIIQVKHVNTNDLLKTCCMNPVLHRLSIRKAEEEIGFEILRNDGDNNRRPSSSPPLHRAVVCSRNKFDHSTDQDKHLISLFFHGGGDLDASPSYWKSYESLRTLDLEDFGLKFLPESIGTLIELRYLGLRNNHIQELPRSLGRLKKLEVLDIAQNFNVEVPDVIWEMSSLRHLYMSDVACRKPLKIDALRHLETLTYVSIDCWIYELSGLQMMTSLYKLGIEELDMNFDASTIFASLAELKHLDHLILRGFRFRSMPCLDGLRVLRGLTILKLDGRLPRLPDFPPALEKLTLVDSCLDEDPMLALDKLSELTHLKLRNAYTGRRMSILRDGFPELEVLCIEGCWNLRSVHVEEGAMPELRKLEINGCPYLDTLTREIGAMTELDRFKIVTSIKIAAKIRNSVFISEVKALNINNL